MKNTGLSRYVYDFLFKYDSVDDDYIFAIFKYLMIKTIWNNGWIYQKNIYSIINCLYNKKFCWVISF